MIKTIDDIFSLARQKGHGCRLVLCQASNEHALEAALEASAMGFVTPILVGRRDEIHEAARNLGRSVEGVQIVEAEDAEGMVEAAVRMVSSGQADILMKGGVTTPQIMKGVLNRQWGLRTDRLISHLAVFQIPAYHKLLVLTDAAMKPESSHASVSTQKFAIALSKEWITNAYNDIIAQNRMKIPNEIEINVDTFNDKTTDGQNEGELIAKFNSLIDKEKAAALEQCVLTMFDNFCLYGGGTIAAIGVFMLIAGGGFLGLIAIIAGIGLVINHFSRKKKIETTRQNIEEQYEKKRTNGSQIIRATLAEVVDFRSEFAEKDAESQNVLDFLDQITPDQYVRKLADSNRRIRV